MNHRVKKLASLIEDYKTNVNTMSPLKKQRAEERIRKLMNHASRDVKAQPNHWYFVSPTTGKMLASQQSAITGFIRCDGQTLRIRDYPAIFRKMGYRFTPTKAKWLSILLRLIAPSRARFQLPNAGA
jgi:hypothetical protein